MSNPLLTWNDPLESVNGLGPQRVEFLHSRGFQTVGDLLLRAPLRIIDRRQSPPFKSLIPPPAGEITAVGIVESVGEKGFRNKRRLICIIGDGTGFIQGVWFKSYHYYKPLLIPGRRVAFTGKISMFDGPQMTHPKVTVVNDDEVDIVAGSKLIPVYPSGEEWEAVGLARRHWPRIIKQVIEQWDGSGPYVPEEIRERNKLLTLPVSIRSIHLPETSENYDRGLESLKFAELYHHQLLMVLLRRRRKSGDGLIIEENGSSYERMVAGLPFKLSPSQTKVISDLKSDFTSGHPMYRLLQGEVGAGKTIVALSAAAIIAGADRQTAIMAPTEILARQHYETAIRWCEPAGMKAVLITGGRDPDENRRALYEAATGAANIVIGTHALFQQRVIFPRLGLVVIDEQHRFGVRQRALLVGKASTFVKEGEVRFKPHVLLMSATPIPRTLALAHYGDLDLSFLAPPPGAERKVTTRLVNDSKRDKVFDWLRTELKKEKQGYLVFPVIDEGAEGLQAAEARFDPYSKIDFKGIPTALAHGRLPIEERMKAMDAFRKGEVRLLMATSVIEVGLDVPNATLMVIENAERFGLSQLHQLRGRVGRQGRKGVCVLITKEREGEEGYERIRTLETTSDGLELAEQDLRLRGAGEPLGARQTGAVRFKLADLSMDYSLLPKAHQAAEDTLDHWPDLAPFPELRDKLRQEYRTRPRTILAG